MLVHSTRKCALKTLWFRNALVIASLLACGGEVGSGSASNTCEICSTAKPTIEDTLQVSLAPLESGTGKIEYRLTNLGSRTLRVLRRETALIDSADAFEVLRDDKPAGYTGWEVRWAPPNEGDFSQLAPGATLSKTIDLTLSVSRTTIEGTHAARDERFRPSAKRRVERARSGGREVVLSYGYFDVPRVVHHDSRSTWASGAEVCRISAGLEAATVASSAGVFRSCGVSSERSGQISAGPGWLEARVG